MTLRPLKVLVILTMSGLLANCGIIECRICGGYRTAHITEAHTKAEPTTITVTGYGAIDPALANNPPQQTLMALRASEVEAYRTLAERVRGVEISANTRVSDFIADSDRINALVDAFTLREARIVTQGMNKEGYYETTVAITLEEQFFAAPLATMERYVYKPARSKYYSDHRKVLRTHSTVETHYDTGIHRH